MRKLLIIISSIIFATACQQNDEDSYPLSSTETFPLEIFSKLLSKAITNSNDLRTFIKKEALEMLDNDYDIFYPIAKNKIVTENKTFRDILKQYDNNNELDELEQKLPLLTILIPELPSGYSANTWDCSEEIPYVVPRIVKNGSISYYQDGMVDINIDANYIPGFPVLVVKNNERIVRNTSVTRATGAPALNSEYLFVDAAFDRSSNPHSLTLTRSTASRKKVLETAYETMGVTSEKWQRDNIYYGLTPNIIEGSLKRNFAEVIECIRFTEQAFTKMCDQNDPTYNRNFFGKHLCPPKKEHEFPNTASLWQDGRFEFKIDITINNQAGLGTNITKYFSVSPYEIFDIKLENNRSAFGHKYIARGVSPKEFYPNITLVTWDLEQNSFSWRISVFEVDDQETYTTQETITSEFASNFGLSVGGDNKKVGLNFGASGKVTKQTQFTRVTYKNSDDLGTLEANFSDPIFLNSYHELYRIKNPMVELALVPDKQY